MQIRVRPAQERDAAALGVLHVEAWRAGYADLMPAPFLAALSAEERAGEWRGRLVPSAGGPMTLVAEERGELLGFATFGPSRDEDRRPWTGELFALNVAPRAWGKGVGRALMSACWPLLAAAGHRRATLWVLEGNDRAIDLYTRAGLLDDGGRKTLTLGGAPLTERRMALALPPQPFAEGFAAALAARDLDRAARYLEEGCAVETPWGEVVGAEAAVRAWRAADEDAEASVEARSHEALVDLLAGERYRLRCTDRLRLRGHVHPFRYQLILTLPPGQGLVRVQHRDLPGERARLRAFYLRAG